MCECNESSDEKDIIDAVYEGLKNDFGQEANKIYKKIYEELKVDPEDHNNLCKLINNFFTKNEIFNVNDISNN